MNMKTIMQRYLMPLLIGIGAMMHIAPVRAQATCGPISTSWTTAKEISIPAQTLSSSKIQRDQWMAAGTYESGDVVVMGPDCTGGYQPKQFLYSGKSGQPGFLDFAPNGKAIFQVSETSTNVGITIEVKNVSMNSGWITVGASTGLIPLKYTNKTQPTINVRVTLYVRIPSAQQPGTLVTGADYMKNIFGSTYDQINTNTDKQPEFPVKVRLGNIVLQRPTCSFAPSERDKSINMGQIDATTFTGDGSKSPDFDFNVSTEGCTGVTTDLYMTFSGQGTSSTNSALFPTDRSELGLGLISLDSRGALASPNGQEAITPGDQLEFSPATPADNAATYRFKAYLEQVGSGPVSSGGVDAKVQVMVNYD